jgi:flagellar biosynthesis protein FliR
LHADNATGSKAAQLQAGVKHMLTLQINTAGVAVYLAILLRLSVVVFMLPPLSNSRIPFRIKACVVVALATMLYPLLNDSVAPLTFQPGALLWTVIGEILFGMVLAFSLLVILAGFDFAGQIVSYLTGLAFAQVVDPQGGNQTTIFSNLLQMLAMLLLFSLNGHHVMLKTIIESFRTIPIGEFVLQTATLGRLIMLTGHLFVIAIKIASPVMVVLILTQVSIGVVSKFVPRINILVTSFPLTILVGLLFVAFSLPLWGSAMKHLLVQVFALMQTIAGLTPSL